MTDSRRTSAQDGDAEAPLAFRVVRGGLWVALASYFNVAAGFAANLALTRILSPEDFGVIALAGFFYSVVDIRQKIGISSAFAQRVETTGELIATHLVLDITAGVIGLFLAGVAALLLGLVGYPLDVIWAILALTSLAICGAVMTTAQLLLEKNLRFAETSTVATVAFGLSYAPAFWLALNHGGYWSLVSQTATYMLLLSLGMWWFARRRLPALWQLRWRFDRKVAIALVRFGGFVGIMATAATLLVQLDNFLVGTFVGIATLGFYDRAYRIAQWPYLIVTSVISRAAFYTYARLQDDAARLAKTVTMSLWLITTLALPLAAAIFAAAPDLVNLLYGERWLASALFLRFLVAYSVLRPLLEDAGSLLVAVGKPRLSAVVTVAELATLAVAGVPLTLLYGAVGTCFAVGIAFTLGLILTYRCVIRIVSIALRSALGIPIAATILALVAYVVLARLADLNSLPLAPRVVGKMGFVFVVYFAIILVVQGRLAIDRAFYVWRLARGRAGSAP